MRYAIYWAPEADDPLWDAGCRWLGRDPTSDAAGTPPARRSEPWRYGFHATLKAPMGLRDPGGLEALVGALERIALAHPSFVLPPLAVGTLGRFVALRPQAPDADLQALADTCVRELDPWRQPWSPEALERRSAGLDDEQRALLQRWGYPHVFARWRFHLTLTDPIDDDGERLHWQALAEHHFAAALGVRRRVRSVALFEEPFAGDPLRLVQRFPLR